MMLTNAPEDCMRNAIPGSARPAPGQKTTNKMVLRNRWRRGMSVKCRNNEFWGCEVHQRMSNWLLRCQWHDMKESMHEWLYEPTNQWIMNQWMYEHWITKSISQWVIETLNQWVPEVTTLRIYEPLNQWNKETMNQWIEESMVQWVKESLNHWTKKSMIHWTKKPINQWNNKSLNRAFNSMN